MSESPKEFENWLNKEYPDVSDYCPQCPEIAAEAWKAALEWVLEKDKQLTTEYKDSSYAAILVLIEIKKKLRETE